MHSLLVEDLCTLCVIARGSQTVDLKPPVAGELALLKDRAIRAEKRDLTALLTDMKDLWRYEELVKFTHYFGILIILPDNRFPCRQSSRCHMNGNWTRSSEFVGRWESRCPVAQQLLGTPRNQHPHQKHASLSGACVRCSSYGPHSVPPRIE